MNRIQLQSHRSTESIVIEYMTAKQGTWAHPKSVNFHVNVIDIRYFYLLDSKQQEVTTPRYGF